MRTLLVIPTLVSAAALASQVTDYAPKANVECPDLSTAPLIRTFTPQNQTLHPAEKEYVTTRKNTVIASAWVDWLGNGSALGYDLTNFNASSFPTVGFAIPGGGLRAAQYGAGVIQALDARNTSAKAIGTGGLLQVASYITGLSGTSLSLAHVERIQLNLDCRWLLGHWLASIQQLAHY